MISVVYLEQECSISSFKDNDECGLRDQPGCVSHSKTVPRGAVHQYHMCLAHVSLSSVNLAMDGIETHPLLLYSDIYDLSMLSPHLFLRVR